MKNTYKITGMSCQACAQVVHSSLVQVTGIDKVAIDLSKEEAVLIMENPIPLEILQTSLKGTLYSILEKNTSSKKESQHRALKQEVEDKKKLVSDYVTAAGRKDYKKLHEYLHEDFKFDAGVKIDSAADYIQMLKEHQKFYDAAVNNDIKAVFVDGNEACVIYDQYADQVPAPISFMERIELGDGLILSTAIKFERNSMKVFVNTIRKR